MKEMTIKEQFKVLFQALGLGLFGGLMGAVIGMVNYSPELNIYYVNYASMIKCGLLFGGVFFGVRIWSAIFPDKESKNDNDKIYPEY